jgi:predicted Zn-ribbon and HTH transcriptional regulator
MIDLLSEEEMSAIEVSQELRIAEKEVYTHLPHIARSVATPRCKATYIQRPAYRIS